MKNYEETLDLIDRMEKEIKEEKVSLKFLQTELKYMLASFILLKFSLAITKNDTQLSMLITIIALLFSFVLFPSEIELCYSVKRFALFEKKMILLDKIQSLRDMVEHPEKMKYYYFDENGDKYPVGILRYYKEDFRKIHPSEKDDQLFKDLFWYISDQIFEYDGSEKRREKREEYLKDHIFN